MCYFLVQNMNIGIWRNKTHFMPIWNINAALCAAWVRHLGGRHKNCADISLENTKTAKTCLPFKIRCKKYHNFLFPFSKKRPKIASFSKWTEKWWNSWLALKSPFLRGIQIKGNTKKNKQKTSARKCEKIDDIWRTDGWRKEFSCSQNSGLSDTVRNKTGLEQCS